jgi:hypothetical protein
MDRVAATSNSKNQLWYAMIWLVTTLLLVVTLQFVGVSEAAGDPRSIRDTPPDFALTTVSVEDDSLPSALYGGALWTVTDTRVEAGTGLLSRAIVEIDVMVANTLDQTQLRLPDSMTSLSSTEGGMSTAVRFVDAGGLVAVEPGEQVGLTLEFEVGFSKDPPVESLSLVIGERNRLPAAIPLGGSGIADVAVVQAAIGSDPVKLTDPDDASRQVVVDPAAVVISINAGPYRAELGERLAVVTVDVQRTSSDAEQLYNSSFWGLEADGALYAPVVVARSGQPSANTDEISLLFSFPETAGDLSLVVGRTDSESAQFPIVIPH